MSDEPTDPIGEEDPPAPKSRRFCSSRYMILPCLIIVTTLIYLGIYMAPLTGLTPNANAQDILELKNQTASLANRIETLEAAGKVTAPQSNNPEVIKDLETRITTLSQQIETIQKQTKVEISPQQIERSNAFEKDLTRLTETQKLLKSVLLFWRLRTKVLSGNPYSEELTDFKGVMKDFEGLPLLEKYADEGLLVIKETPADSQTSSDEPISWWERLKGMAGSLIKVEKVDAPLTVVSSSSQERQAVEEALEQIDETLTQQLMATPVTSSPQSGDAL